MRKGAWLLGEGSIHKAMGSSVNEDVMGFRPKFTAPGFKNVRLQWVVGRRQAKQRLWRSKARQACCRHGFKFAKLYMLCCWLHCLWVAGDLDDEQVSPAVVLPVVRHNISIAFEACLCDKVANTCGAVTNLTGTPGGSPDVIPGGTALSLPSVLPFPEACACSQGYKTTVKLLREVKVSHCLIGGGRSRQVPVGGGKVAGTCHCSTLSAVLWFGDGVRDTERVRERDIQLHVTDIGVLREGET